MIPGADMYKPPLQESAGICPRCGKPMVKHIFKEGARYHVISWHGSKNGATSHCSELDCEENHGPGHCVPLDAGPVKLPKFEFPKITITDDECTLHRKIW